MLNALMLLGLLGLAIPVIIHLIQKQRLTPQPLATIQFLDRQDVANAFAPVPRDMLQLLLRLLLLTLFIVLMSRLALGGREPGPRALAVILDDSMSMQQQAEGNQTLFARHKAQILQLIDGLRPADRMALILVGDRVVVETGYLRDKQALRRIAESFQVSDSGGLALMPAIRNTVDQLRSRREVNAAVLVFSDHQRVNYQHFLDEAAQGGRENRTTAFRRALDRSAVKVMLIDEHPAAGDNLAIEDARFLPERVYLGSSAKTTVLVRNLAASEKLTRVVLYEGTQAGENRTLPLAAGEVAYLDLVHRFESPIDVACRVEIEDDVLRGDNTFHVGMRMKERKQVLLVAAGSGREEQEELEIRYAGADLLAYALNPGEVLGAGAGTYISVKRVTPALLDRVSLPLYSLVVVYGVTDIPEQSAKDLGAFVNNGGGLYLIPDEDVAPLRFNQTYGNVLGGLQIGQLKEPDTAQPIDRNEGKIAHPLLLPLVHGEWGDLREIHFQQYFGVVASGTAEPALRAANGDPLGFVVSLGRGRVYVQMFSCALSAGSLPRSTAFVPMVQTVLAGLTAPREPEGRDTMRVGDALRVRLPEFRGLTGQVLLSGPEKLELPLIGSGGDEIRVAGLLHAGPYEISHSARKSGRKRWLTVNPVQGESRLTPITEEEQAVLFGRKNSMRMPFGALEQHFSRRHELVALLSALVALAFLVEAIVGAWQSRRAARRFQEEGQPA